MPTEPEIPEDWKANYNLATAIVNSRCEEDHWPMLLVRAIREIAALEASNAEKDETIARLSAPITEADWASVRWSDAPTYASGVERLLQRRLNPPAQEVTDGR
jgi:hypothetical protein